MEAPILKQVPFLIASVQGEIRVNIDSEADTVTARQRGRELSASLGFTPTEVAIIAMAISELARDVMVYAKHGEIVLAPTRADGRTGITVVAPDNEPGISDVSRAMQDGCSSGDGLGLGLPGAKRPMDDFEIVSEMGRGETVTAWKWLR